MTLPAANLQAEKPIVPMPLKPHIVPYRHQVRAFNQAVSLTGFAALMDMGTGKTLTTVAVAGWRYRTGRIRRLLIVAPTSVCHVWPAEFEKTAAFPYTVAVLLGDRQKRLERLSWLSGTTGGLQVAVINYESTWRLLDELKAFAPEMVVCDESQRIKNPVSKQSKALHQLGDQAKYRMILTGTPVQRNPLDLWSQYRFLDPAVYGRNYYQFRGRYAVMGGPNHQMVLTYKHLPELTRKAHSVAYRVTKEECLDLPEQVFETRPVPLPDHAMKLYRQLKRESLTFLESGIVTAQNVLVRLLRLQQLAGGFLRTDEAVAPEWVHTGKLDALDDILQDHVLDGGQKLVILARFLPEVEAIRKLLEKRGIQHVAIWGEIPPGKRGAIVKQFQEDPETLVFVAQLDTAGEGITLNRCATTVYYSVNFNWAKYSQSLARTHRIGQDRVCTYIHLTAPKTIDEDIMQALARKADLAKLVVDNWRDYFSKEDD